MNATTVAVDLAKSVFEVAVADSNWKIVERARLTRTQFERFFANRQVTQVIMEACGSAHHWARWLTALGIEARLLPAQYVRAYVKRNKTDAADAAALTAVELECPAGDVVEEITVMRYHDDGAGVVAQVILEPGDRFGVEVVCRFVEQQQVRL